MEKKSKKGKSVPDVYQRIDRKKTQVVGKRKLFDEDGGEYDVQVIEHKTARDFNFKKIYLYELLMATEELTNLKTKIALMILELADDNNLITLPTQRALAHELKCSRTILGETVRMLIHYQVICKVKGFAATYVINPNIVCKTDAQGRIAVLKLYNLHANEEATTKVNFRKGSKKGIIALSARTVNAFDDNLPPKSPLKDECEEDGEVFTLFPEEGV